MTAQTKPLTKRTRRLISGLVVAHLLAVVLPPLAFQTRGPLGPSPSVATLFGWFRRYSQMMYLDRGYAFFAPDPGPSHLVQAAITGSGGESLEVMYPDRREQWPRLLYHRHFMLTEFLEEIYQPPGPPPELVELDPVEADYWRGARARYEHVRQSYIDHLRAEHPGREVSIRRIEHLIPDVLAFQEQPIPLTDESSYRVILDLPVEWEAGDTNGEVESIPPPSGAAAERAQRRQAGSVESPATSTLPPAVDRPSQGEPPAESPPAEATPGDGP